MESKKVTELKALCSSYGLRVTGTKSELIARLNDYTTKQTSKRSPELLTLLDLPNELFSSVIWPLCEFYDLESFSGINKRFRALMTDSLIGMTKTRPIWERQQIYVWAARFASLEIVSVLFQGVKLDGWSRKWIVLYLEERGANNDLFTLIDAKKGSCNVWTLAKQLLLNIRHSAWLMIDYAVSPISTQSNNERLIYLGQLLASSLDVDLVRQMVEYAESKESSMHLIIRYIVLAYIQNERWSDYDQIFANVSKKVRTSYTKRLLPYIKPQTYSRATGGLVVNKSVLKDRIYDRELYRSLDDDLRKQLAQRLIFNVATPEEAMERLEFSDSVSIGYIARANDYVSWGTYIDDISSLAK